LFNSATDTPVEAIFSLKEKEFIRIREINWVAALS
jgi:hypothetical protein